MSDKEFEAVLDKLVAQLIARRKETGLSHEELTGLTGLSRTAISYTESCKSTPPIITVLKLCAALDVKLSNLLREKGVTRLY